MIYLTEEEKAELKGFLDKGRCCPECGNKMFFDDNLSWYGVKAWRCKGCGRIKSFPNTHIEHV